MADCDITGDDGGANLNNPNSIVDAAVEAGSGEPKKKKTHRLKQRFQVIKKLGQGTYGKVQLAINNESGQEVAIKTIKKSKVANQQDLIRIRREIQIMSSINHPNIIHIFEVFENKDKIVLVMQYASGGELYDYVSYHKVLSDTEARRVFRQIATAIYYCHKNKICHRDLKLENILLDEKGNAKIADFGLSNVFDEKHFLQTFCGSPLYASPEIVRGLPYFGPEVDCWSLGVLLYTLVYGAMPFDGSNFKKLVKQISEANYYEPTNKSEASDLIRRLLAPNPRERATIIDICTDEWVNLECEHSLLQLAEDLSNLTKYAVRLDMLLALAPVSPTTDQVAKETTEKSTPQEGDQEKAVEEESGAEKRPVDNTSFNVSSSDVIEKKASKKKIKKSDTATVEEKESVKDSSQYEDKPMEVVPPEPDLSQTPESSSQQQPEAPSEDTSPTEDPTPAPVSEPISEDITDPQIITSADTTEVVEEKKDKEPASNLSQSASTSSNTSVGKRPGRVSIPSIWNSSQEKLAPESPQDKKAPFIPVGFKVSEAKQVLERRCSVDSNKGSAAKRRESLAATSELATGQQKRDVKKYTTRSLSLNEIGSDKKYVPAKRTIKPVIEEKRVEEAKEEKTEPEVVKVPSRDGTPISTDQESSKPSTPITEDDKSIAKLIIKKNIAKAKLMEKRQGSVTPSGSEPTTPLVAIENSSVSTIQFPSNSSTFTETRDKQSELVQSQTGSEDNTGEVCQVATPASAAAPITRSYKKVTFTKDGACITESGKFYSKEGKDGVVTRVEKKSKVTHIIGGQPPTSTVNLQRSDSQSSSGSTDIFDDIFDDHWTGDVFFSNFKSLFNNFFDNSGNNTRGVGSGNDDRRSLRSRAESLERTNWFAGRPNRRTAFSTDNSFDSNSSIFDSHKSLFQTKSIFSSSFKSNFDKEFDDLMSRKSTLLPRLTRQFGDSESESNSTSRRFADVDPDPVESTRKRVEQWLQLDDSKDKFGSIGSYGTMGPRASRRYMRTMTSNESGSNFVKHSEVTKSSNSSSHEIIRQQTSSSIQNMKKEVVPQGSEVEIKFSLDGLGGELGKSMLSSATFTMDKSISSESNNSMIKIAEPSSLLEQLRTIGYKKMVSRRLSDESSEEGEPTVASQSASSLARSTEDGTQGNGVPVGAFTETPLVGQRRDRGGVADQHESTRSLGGENESVQERIHRKSYYSRFNDTATTMVRQRRRSVTRLSNDLAELYSSPTGSVGTTTGGRVRSGTTGLYSRSPSYGFSLDSGSSSSLTSRTRTHWTSSVTRRTTLRSTSLDANSDKHTRENDS